MVDFDGKIACTVFTGGCNFRCPFCHNALLVTELDGSCVIPEEEVLAFLGKRRGLLDGVCVTGGEPLMNRDIGEFLQKVKALGFKVKLDTNGTNPDLLKELVAANLVDYVAMDVKNSPEKYALTVGLETLDFAPVEESIKFLLGGAVDYEFRTTLIGEFHKKNNIENIALWLKGAKKFFFQKYKDSDNCIEHGFTEVPQKTAEEYLSVMKNTVKYAALRGYDID